MHYFSDFSSEENLIASFPLDLDSSGGTKYCLSRAYIGDFDFVRRYRLKQLDGVDCNYYVAKENLDKIIAYFNIPID